MMAPVMLPRPSMLLCFALVACGDSTVTPTPTDAASDLAPDARADAAPDAMDRGTCDNPVAPYPAALAPRCMASTAACIARCAGMGSMALACQSACARADTTPSVTTPVMGGGSLTLNCSSCVTFISLRCMEVAGCTAQSYDYRCCAAARCAGSSDPTCASTMCANELRALLTCAPVDCLNYLGAEFRLCYERAPMDGGVDASTDASGGNG